MNPYASDVCAHVSAVDPADDAIVAPVVLDAVVLTSWLIFHRWVPADQDSPPDPSPTPAMHSPPVEVDPTVIVVPVDAPLNPTLRAPSPPDPVTVTELPSTVSMPVLVNVTVTVCAPVGGFSSLYALTNPLEPVRPAAPDDCPDDMAVIVEAPYLTDEMFPDAVESDVPDPVVIPTLRYT